MVGGALHLVRGQSQELGSPVGEAEGQVRAAAVVGASAASHDAAHEIGHSGLHPCEHSTPAGGGGGSSAGTTAQGGERGAPGAALRGSGGSGSPAALPQWGRRAARGRARGRRAQGQPRGRGLIAGFPLPARRWVNSARRQRLLSHVIARLDSPGRFLLLLRHRRAPGTRRAREAAAPARLPALWGGPRQVRGGRSLARRGRPRLPAAVRPGPEAGTRGRACGRRRDELPGGRLMRSRSGLHYRGLEIAACSALSLLPLG